LESGTFSGLKVETSYSLDSMINNYSYHVATCTTFALEGIPEQACCILANCFGYNILNLQSAEDGSHC